MKAKKWVLVNKFDGLPKADDFSLVEEDLPTLQQREVLFEAVFLSVDPYMRLEQFLAEIPKGGAMIGTQIAKVVESCHPDYKKGGHYQVSCGWRTHTVLNPDKAEPPLQPVNHLTGSDLSMGLGLAGMPGATAYLALVEKCSPQEGDTVLVSSAAGAVGYLAGQIAKIKGCKVIGCAGTDEKVSWLKEDLGFDYTFNYKKEDLSKTLTLAAPDRINCYFDNVGGEFGNTVVLKHMATQGRVVCVGFISGYNDPSPATGPLPFPIILIKALKVEGFTFFSESPEKVEGAMKQMYEWAKQGKLKNMETITEGFENMPGAFIGLFTGKHTGKALVKV